MIKFILILPISSLLLNGFCQEVKLSEAIVSAAEELAAEEGDPMAAEIFTELLYELSEDPVEINSGNENEISRLFFLSTFQVKVLSDYVRISGSIVSPFEIANIPGFDRETASMMIPFITLVKKSIAFHDTVRIHHSMLTNFTFKKNNENSTYIGSPWKLLTKYKFTAGSFSGGFTGEKDQGEKLFSGHPPLPDFLSGHLFYKGTGIIKRVAAGDYSARFGLGTNINTGISSGLSLSSPGYLAGRDEIKPYTSAEENKFFRGTAVVLAVKNLDFSLFVSSKKIDAILNEDTDSANYTIRSIYRTGYHNTESGLQKKDIAREVIYGMNLSCNFKNLKAGILWSETRFSIPFEPDTAIPSDIYDFRGTRNSLYSLYYSSLLKRYILFGELSWGGYGRYSIIQGVSFRPADRLNINVIYRNYSPRFIALHGGGPGLSTSGNNEEGIFGNFTFEAAKYLFISAGSDVRSFPWLRYRCSSPTSSERHEIRIRYLPSGRLTIESMYGIRKTQADNSGDSGIPSLVLTKTRSARVQVKYSPEENITLLTRLDFKNVMPSGTKGVSLLQDINIRLMKIPVSIWMRYCLYNTGGYESGIYTWENDLQSSFSIPVMYGSGSRAFVMLSWKPADGIEFRIKYGFTERKVSGVTGSFPEIKAQFKIFI